MNGGCMVRLDVGLKSKSRENEKRFNKHFGWISIHFIWRYVVWRVFVCGWMSAPSTQEAIKLSHEIFINSFLRFYMSWRKSNVCAHLEEKFVSWNFSFSSFHWRCLCLVIFYYVRLSIVNMNTCCEDKHTNHEYWDNISSFYWYFLWFIMRALCRNFLSQEQPNSFLFSLIIWDCSNDPLIHLSTLCFEDLIFRQKIMINDHLKMHFLLRFLTDEANFEWKLSSIALKFSLELFRIIFALVTKYCFWCWRLMH